MILQFWEVTLSPRTNSVVSDRELQVTPAYQKELIGSSISEEYWIRSQLEEEKEELRP